MGFVFRLEFLKFFRTFRFTSTVVRITRPTFLARGWTEEFLSRINVVYSTGMKKGGWGGGRSTCEGFVSRSKVARFLEIDFDLCVCV